MRNLAKISAAVVICIGAAAGVWANDGPRPEAPKEERFQPFAAMSVPKAPLCFGVVSGLRTRRLKASTAVRVLANRPFGVTASFQGLTLQGGPAAIPPQHVRVTINGKNVPLGTERVRIATGGPTSMCGVEVPIVIEIEVTGAGFNPAGQYGGNLELSIL